MRKALLLSVAIFVAGAFAVLRGERALTLEIDMEVSLEGSSRGRVSWYDGEREQYAAGFDVRSGREVHRIPVSTEARVLRIVPVRVGGAMIVIHRLTLRSYGVPLQSWGGGTRFSDWYAAGDVDDVDAQGGALRLRSTGLDPQIQSEPIDPRRRQALVHAGLALLSGMALALLHARATRALTLPVPEVNTASAGDGKAFALLAVSVLASGLMGYWLYHHVLAPARSLPAPFQDAFYRPGLVDPQGRPLTTRPIGVKLVLDPFTVFRNLPNQRSERFTIDGRGYRAGPPSRPGQPRAVVLGASTAFGYGLERDEDTFVAQLGRLRPEWEWTNAGVIGFLSGQELAMMVHYADALNPRYYVVFDGWNEQLGQWAPNDRGYGYGYNWQMFGEIADRLLAAAVRDGLRPFVPPAAPTPNRAASQLWLEQAYVENLDRMAAFARSRRSELLVVFQPHLTGKRTRTPEEEQYLLALKEWLKTPAHVIGDGYAGMIPRVRLACEQKGIAYVDLTAAAEFRESAETLYSDDVHLNARGNRVVADILARHLAPREGDRINPAADRPPAR